MKSKVETVNKNESKMASEDDSIDEYEADDFDVSEVDIASTGELVPCTPRRFPQQSGIAGDLVNERLALIMPGWEKFKKVEWWVSLLLNRYFMLQNERSQFLL